MYVCDTMVNELFCEKTGLQVSNKVRHKPVCAAKCEPRHEKNWIFANATTKTQISCVATAQLISAFVFAT